MSINSRVRSVSQQNFARNPHVRIPRSAFKQPFSHKTTFNSGFLIPFSSHEILPGDTLSSRVSGVVRISDLIHPFMDDLTFEMFAFFVPNRLVWEHWINFMGEQANPTDSIDYTVPVISDFTHDTQSIFDYYGIPAYLNGSLLTISGISALYFRAYNKIVNDWFRDENLQNSLPLNVGDGPDDASSYSLFNFNKRFDYFTSALPWPQKGPAVELSLSGYAPVVPSSNPVPIFNYQKSDGSTFQEHLSSVYQDSSNSFVALGGQSVGNAVPINSTVSWASTGLQADMSQTTAITVNDLRNAIQMQVFFEKMARGGSRYTEIITQHFGVTSPDARLQRSEFLGSFSVDMLTSAVQQTYPTMEGSTSPQANLAANGMFTFSNQSLFHKSFTEHGIVLVLGRVRSFATYQAGIDRKFFRSTRDDFYWPSFAHLGEQSLFNKELFYQGPSVVDANGDAVDDDVFGYQERYAEYRYNPSQISGYFRSSSPDTLDSWHLAQNFTALPTLSSSFIQENAPVNRIVAISGSEYPQFISDINFINVFVRCMPTYSVPAGLSSGRI